MKTVLLIDVDSKIPNLALMKISAYHKSIGDNVSFYNTHSPEIVYASVVFKKNKHLVDGLSFYYPNSKIVLGGSGYDLEVKLPDEIEKMMPDYSIYPEIDYSLGYTTRGCNRECGFCIVPNIVPKKEGKFIDVCHPSQFYNSDFNKIVFLDNNILLSKLKFMEVTNFCIEKNLSVWFTQGLDIRLLDNDIAHRLGEIKHFKGLFFAFDNSNLKSTVKEKCILLKEQGINLRSDVQFYVYVDSDNQYDDAVSRCRTLKEIGTNAFVMYNIDKKPTQRINDLSCDISEYRRN